MPFPGVRGSFESLKLLQYFEHSAFAEGLRSDRDVLPAQEPAHELRRRDRLNFVAQPADSQLVNASQQPALAPLRFSRRRVGERSAQDRARSLHAQEGFVSISLCDSEDGN